MDVSTFWKAAQRTRLGVIRFGKKLGLPGRAYLAYQSLTRSGPKRAVFFPGRMITGHSGDLRATSLGAPLKKFGWRVITAPSWLTLEERLALLRKEKPHVVLLQQSAHPLNRPALYPGYTTLYDVDDADYAMEPELVATCCRTASGCVTGNRHLAEVFLEYGAKEAHVLWTGTYVKSIRGAKPNSERAPVIAWAPSIAQLFPREAEEVREAMLLLAKQHRFIFRIYGNDAAWTNEYVAPLREAGVEVQLFGARPYRQYVQSLGTVAIGLQPVLESNPFSRGKSFGKVLAYMAAHVAVVASDAVDHPLFFRHGENGMLVRTAQDWADACAYLLDHPVERGQMVQVAYQDFLCQLTSEAAAEGLGKIMDRFVPAGER